MGGSDNGGISKPQKHHLIPKTLRLLCPGAVCAKYISYALKCPHCVGHLLRLRCHVVYWGMGSSQNNVFSFTLNVKIFCLHFGQTLIMLSNGAIVLATQSI